MDKVLLAAGGLLVGGAAVAGSVGGDQERVAGLWASATVDSTGDAEITEVIVYDFGSLATDKHGIFRDVPGLDAEALPELDLAIKTLRDAAGSSPNLANADGRIALLEDALRRLCRIRGDLESSPCPFETERATIPCGRR